MFRDQLEFTQCELANYKNRTADYEIRQTRDAASLDAAYSEINLLGEIHFELVTSIADL